MFTFGNFQFRKRKSHGSTSGDVIDRAQSERDYRVGRDSRQENYRHTRDQYYENAHYYSGGHQAPGYGPYSQYPSPYPSQYPAQYPSQYPAHYSAKYHQGYAYSDYAAYQERLKAWSEEMKKNHPEYYAQWYRHSYGQHYAPSVTTGAGTAAGSMAPSEVDRASVHSGRSSVNEQNDTISHQVAGSVNGLKQSDAYDYSSYQVRCSDGRVGCFFVIVHFALIG